jgi:putative ABC transport system substrate-binding protein
MASTRRRRLLIALGATLAAPSLHAQPAGRVHRVGIVLVASPVSEMAGPDPVHPLTRVILHELRSLGYVEGRNLIFERRSAEGNAARHREIIDELIALRTEVIVLSGSPDLIRTARSATRATPIVVMGYPRFVEDGFAISLARPGGSITGPSFATSIEDEAKRLELFKQLVPALSRVGFVAPSGFWTEAKEAVAKAAEKLGIKLAYVEQHATDLQVTFAAIAQAKVDGLFIAPSSLAYAQRESLGRLALAAGLPACAAGDRHVEVGALMSYAPSLAALMRRVAYYVDRILKGASPADLPIERPATFELVVNMKTAKVLGLTVAPAALLSVDRLIE